MAKELDKKIEIKIKENCSSYTKPLTNPLLFSKKIAKGTKMTVTKLSSSASTTMYYVTSSNNSGSWVNSKYCKVIKKEQKDEKPKKKPLVKDGKKGDKKGGKKGLKDSKKLDAQMKKIVVTKRDTLASTIDGSMRMFGMPHQMMAATDKRISEDTGLGTVFTEHFIADAPVIFLKPGKSNFLPGMSNSEKKGMVNSIINSAKGNKKTKGLADQLKLMKDNDWRYFDFKEDYAAYIRNVNVLCRLCAVFLRLNDKKVPWQAGKATYGTYDWSGYTFETLYNNKTTVPVKPAKNVNTKKESTSLLDKIWSFVKGMVKKVKKTVKSVVSNLLSDDNFVRFYVDASVGFSESVTNSTSQSIVNSYIDNMEAIGKELSFVSGATGVDIDKVIDKSSDRIDAAANKILAGDGAVSNFLKRLTGTGKQVLTGANFIAPDVWSGAEYSKSYNFSITLSTPYGNTEAWYLNVCVPLIHLLALALPRQNTANTYNAPFLVRAYSPGWFSCDLGVIDSLTINKAPSGDAWGQNSLPLEIKIDVSIKELYSSLAVPDGGEFKLFFANTGLMNYLMINCGVDITKQTLDLQVTVFVNMFKNVVKDAVNEWSDSIWYKIKSAVRDMFGLWH